MKILVAGASGFIGSHLVRALAANGHEVITAGRAIPVGHSGSFVPVDFSGVPAADWWAPRLGDVAVVINAVGILREGSRQTFDALHKRAPIALFDACAQAGVRLVIQISALGSDVHAATPFHLSKRAADDALRALPVASIIVQPSLVYSPGGRSADLFNRLAALPLLALPHSGPVQPVHITDLVEGVLHGIDQHADGSQTIAFVGPAPLTLSRFIASLRKGMGIARPARVLLLPARVSLALGAVAAWLPGSLLDRDAVRMLLRGSAADPQPFVQLLGHAPRSVASFINPEGASGIHTSAVVGWMLPVLNGCVAFVWIWTGIVSLGVYPVQDSLQLLREFGINGQSAMVALVGAGLLDLLFGVLTLTAKGRLRFVVLVAQLLLILAYTAMITVRLPDWWLHPFGPISKNLPMMAVIVLLLWLQPRK